MGGLFDKAIFSRQPLDSQHVSCGSNFSILSIPAVKALSPGTGRITLYKSLKNPFFGFL